MKSISYLDCLHYLDLTALIPVILFFSKIVIFLIIYIKTKKEKFDLAASFQNTINKILYKKTKIAIEMFKKNINSSNVNLVVAGGVAANISIRENLKKLSKEIGFKVIYPNLKFCSDNAAMIAWAGIKRFKKKLLNEIDVNARSRWPLDENAPYMKGPGLKL